MRGKAKKSDSIRETVQKAYADIASGRRGGCCGPRASCCGASDPHALARGIGYSEEELADLPEGANMGLSCGNPSAIASLRPGETVLDLGSGGGFDVFVAARKVGPTGRAIGVDMTPEMLTKARRNAETFRRQTGLENVEFRLGEIEHLAVADESADVVISNCVINLSPDKPQVWREIARVLKPGGRVAVSDLALLKPLPPAVSECVEALVGCVAGAVLVADIEAMAADAGLVDIRCDPKPEVIESMSNWNDPLYKKVQETLPPGARISDYVTSLYATARKPARQRPQAEKRLGQRKEHGR